MKKAFLLLLCSLAITADAQTFTSEIVRSQPGMPNFGARALNNFGVIAGSVVGNRAAYWHEGIVTILPQGLGSDSLCNLNDLGTFVGYSSGSGSSGAAKWDADGFARLNASGEARGVNNAGWIVGGGGTAFLWRNGVVQNLGNLGIPGNDSCHAVAVNDNGVVAGWEYNGEVGTSARAWIWTEAGGMQQIYAGRSTRDINELGQVAVGGGVWHAGVFMPLDRCDTALAINDSGVVVGVGTGSLPVYSVWRNGIRYAIDTLLGPGHEMFVDGVLDINDNGQLLVGGTRNGQSNTYLLSPVPEPGTVAALGLGVSLPIATKIRPEGYPPVNSLIFL